MPLSELPLPHGKQRRPRWRLNRRLIAWAIRISEKLLRRGWGSSAVAILQQVVDFEPRSFVARIKLAHAALSIGDDGAASDSIRPDAIDNLPDVSFHLCRIARVHMSLEDLGAAERYLNLARDQNPESRVPWRMLGELNRLRGNVDEAVRCFQHVSPLEFTRRMKISAIQQGATAMADAGRKDAEQLYQQILQLDPKNPFAHFGLVDCRRRMNLDDPIVQSIRQLISDASIPPSQKSHLHYALGNVYDGNENAAAAFAHWSIGNRLRAIHSRQFHLGKKKAAAAARCKFFSREVIEELSQHGCPDDVLVCVVGMPRSGTTLTEQILGSHSQTRPLGERADFFRMARNLPKLIESKLPYPECCSKLTGKQIANAWGTILDRMRRTAGPCQRMITKLPEDFFEIGLIKILFPKTKIINLQRSPLDVGLSCFMQNFKNIPYSRYVDSLAEMFKIYHQVMRHWRSVLPPGAILDVHYERLVAEPDATVRHLFECIDLPFEPSCLEFYNQTQPVKTCSRWQVRQPIYQSSVNRSEAYREFLAPLCTIVLDARATTSTIT